MNEYKKISAVGTAFPATDKENNFIDIISDDVEKINRSIHEKSKKHGLIVRYTTFGNAFTGYNFVVEFRDGETSWYRFNNGNTSNEIRKAIELLLDY